MTEGRKSRKREKEKMRIHRKGKKQEGKLKRKMIGIRLMRENKKIGR